MWYYEVPPPEGRKQYTKTAPMPFEAFGPVLAWWANREENERAWRVSAEEIAAAGWNLDRKNPHAAADLEHLPPEQLVEGILAKERRIIEMMEEIRGLLGPASVQTNGGTFQTALIRD